MPAISINANISISLSAHQFCSLQKKLRFERSRRPPASSVLGRALLTPVGAGISLDTCSGWAGQWSRPWRSVPVGCPWFGRRRWDEGVEVTAPAPSVIVAPARHALGCPSRRQERVGREWPGRGRIAPLSVIRSKPRSGRRRMRWRGRGYLLPRQPLLPSLSRSSPPDSSTRGAKPQRASEQCSTRSYWFW